MFGRNNRSKRARRRGVSPIIATILLVAITVVLAAVLYVLIAGLTHTGASTPYSLGMSVPSPSNPAAGIYYETITLSPTSGLTTGLFGLALKSSSSASIAAGTATVANCKPGATYGTAACAAPASGAWYAVLYWQGNATVASVYSGGAWTATVGVTSATYLTVVSAATLAGSQDTLNAVSIGSSSVSGQSGLF